MIQIIAGRKGSGKTKRLIDMTNETAKNSATDVIFLDDDNRYMFDVDHAVRFINAEDYHIHNPDMFIGFISGMLSANYDIGTIFIDAFLKICKQELNNCGALFDMMNVLSAKHGVNFVLSVSVDPEEVPENLKEYLI